MDREKLESVMKVALPHHLDSQCRSDIVRAQIAAIESSGYWLAPVEPTVPMVSAGFIALKKLPTSFPDHYAEDCYRAMRDAASPSNKEREDADGA